MAADPARGRAPGAGRPPGAFVQAKRLDRLRAALEQGPAGTTVDELAGHLRCTTRTVRRYLVELQRSLELESYAPAPGEPWRWRIKPSEQSRAVAMRRTHAYALLATKSLFAPMAGSALAAEVDVVTRELLKVAHRPTKRGVRGEVRSDTRLEERFVHVSGPYRTYPDHAGFLDDLFRATANLVPVDASFVDRRGTAVASVYHPYALVLHEGALFVIGHAATTSAVEVTPLEAFERVTVRAGESFSLPHDFDVTRFLDGQLGFAEGPRALVVTIDFDASLADELRHLVAGSLQRVGVSKTTGVVRVRFNASSVDHVVRWVLRFGARAKVVSPREVADAVLREAEGMVRNYRHPPR